MNHISADEFLSPRLEDASLWLNEIMALTESREPEVAYASLRAVLHFLRDQVGVDLAVKVGCELPILLRGLYYEEWQSPAAVEHLHETALASLAGACPRLSAEDLARAVWSVLTVLSHHLSPVTLECVRHQLAPAVRTLWNTAASHTAMDELTAH